VPWLHGKRLALFWLAIVLTVAVVIPAVTVAVGYVLGMTGCRPQFSPSDPWRCRRLAFIASNRHADRFALAAISGCAFFGILACDSKPGDASLNNTVEGDRERVPPRARGDCSPRRLIGAFWRPSTSAAL
jgi:hypothetical protein